MPIKKPEIRRSILEVILNPDRAILLKYPDHHKIYLVYPKEYRDDINSILDSDYERYKDGDFNELKLPMNFNAVPSEDLSNKDSSEVIHLIEFDSREIIFSDWIANNMFQDILEVYEGQENISKFYEKFDKQ